MVDSIRSCKTCRDPDSMRALTGVMPEPVAKMNNWEAALGPALSILNPGPSIGLASTSVSARMQHDLGSDVTQGLPADQQRPQNTHLCAWTSTA